MPEALLLAFARVAPVVALHPVLGGGGVPRTVKAGVAAALACALAPRAAVSGAAPKTAWGFVLTLVGEAAVGTAVGLVGQLTFAAIEAAGRLADDARGASAAQVYAPQTETLPSPLGALEVQAALAVFWLIGGHGPLLSGLAASFDDLPPGAVGLNAAALGAFGLDACVRVAGGLARAGAALAAPAMVACVVADLLFGLVNRSAPQAPVFFLSLPVKLAAALFVLAVTSPDRVALWGDIWALERAVTSSLGGSTRGGS
jgi:flagellar biosynthetic protein FliR